MVLITYVTDRFGHDARYAIDSSKLQKETWLGTFASVRGGNWENCEVVFGESGLDEQNTSGTYKEY